MSDLVTGLLSGASILTGKSPDQLSREIHAEIQKTIEATAQNGGLDLHIDAKGWHLGDASLGERISGKQGKTLTLQRMKKAVQIFEDGGKLIVRRWDGALKTFDNREQLEQSSWVGQSKGDQRVKARLTLAGPHKTQVSVAQDSKTGMWVVEHRNGARLELRFPAGTTPEQAKAKIFGSRLVADRIQQQDSANRSFSKSALTALGRLDAKVAQQQTQKAALDLFDPRDNPKAQNSGGWLKPVTEIIGREAEGAYILGQAGLNRKDLTEALQGRSGQGFGEADRFTALGLTALRQELISRGIGVDANGFAMVTIPPDAEGRKRVAQNLTAAYSKAFQSDPYAMQGLVDWAKRKNLPIRQEIQNNVAELAGLTASSAMASLAEGATSLRGRAVQSNANDIGLRLNGGRFTEPTESAPIRQHPVPFNNIVPIDRFKTPVLAGALKKGVGPTLEAKPNVFSQQNPVLTGIHPQPPSNGNISIPAKGGGSSEGGASRRDETVASSRKKIGVNGVEARAVPNINYASLSSSKDSKTLQDIVSRDNPAEVLALVEGNDLVHIHPGVLKFLLVKLDKHALAETIMIGANSSTTSSRYQAALSKLSSAIQSRAQPETAPKPNTLQETGKNFASDRFGGGAVRTEIGGSETYLTLVSAARRGGALELGKYSLGLTATSVGELTRPQLNQFTQMIDQRISDIGNRTGATAEGEELRILETAKINLDRLKSFARPASSTSP